MPRRQIASENRVGEGGNRFPRLKFQAKGERKRVLLIDPEGPWQEYVHYLRAPIFVEGLPKMKTREKKNGEEVEDYDTEFLSMPLCLGDDAVIEEAGFDAGNCPVCAAIKQAPGEARLEPQLRFAANVVDQQLQHNSWAVQKPYSAKVVVWTFNGNVYDEIVGLQEQHGSLIRERDLNLECTNSGFQQVKIGVAPNPGWKEASAGAYLGELLGEEGNIATVDQLRDACGRSVKRAFLDEDVSVAIRRWNRAVALRGGSPFEDPATGQSLGGGKPAASLADGIAELETAAKESAAAAGSNGAGTPAGLDEFAKETSHGNQVPEKVNLAPGDVDPFGSPSAASPASSPAVSTAPATTPTAPLPSEAPAKSDPKKGGFDALLAGLK